MISNNGDIIKNVVLESKMLNNGSGSSLDANQVTVDQVSNNDNYNNGLMSDNSGEIKNVVLESKVVSRESVCLLYTSRCV